MIFIIKLILLKDVEQTTKAEIIKWASLMNNMLIDTGPILA